MKEEQIRTTFFEAFRHKTEEERKEVCVHMLRIREDKVEREEPYSWNVVMMEVKEKTPLGKSMLEVWERAHKKVRTLS